MSYTIYVTAASAAKATLGTILQSGFTSPPGITLQLLMLAGLVALVRIDWTRILTHRPGSDDRSPPPPRFDRPPSRLSDGHIFVRARSRAARPTR